MGLLGVPRTSHGHLPSSLLSVALLEISLQLGWLLRPPVGAAAQASTHAGQEAEETQADTHDDACD